MPPAMLLALMESPPLTGNLVGPAAIERCCYQEPTTGGSTCNDYLQSHRASEREREREREKSEEAGYGKASLLMITPFGPLTTPFRLHIAIHQ